ncbi:MAG: tetratricopeptide repeat protein [Candidatus Omnitrophica bacterium]|nr:tetratricopeptide repeat protein [Candidatus Omnitrophota bacterium]
MKKILAFYFLIFFIFPGILMAADNPEELYKKGNSNYGDEDYAQAVSSYEKLLEINEVSPEVFYNLGNSYFKLKKIGKDVLNYERALRMDPRDRDIRFNLKLARSMAVDKIDTAERGFALSVIFFLYDRMTLNELTAICSFFYLAIILLLIFSIFFVSKRRVVFYTAGSFGVMLLVFFIFLSAKFKDENFAKTGIIVVEKVDVRSGPKEDYLLQFTLHEGAKASVIKKVQGWYEIDLSRDLKGWIPETSVDII